MPAQEPIDQKQNKKHKDHVGIMFWVVKKEKKKQVHCTCSRNKHALT